MSSKKNNRNSDANLKKLIATTAICQLITAIIALINKIVELLE